MSSGVYLCSNKEIEKLARRLVALGLVRIEAGRKHPVVISTATNRRIAMSLTPSDVRAYDNFVTDMVRLTGTKKRDLLDAAFPPKGKRADADPTPTLTAAGRTVAGQSAHDLPPPHLPR